MPSIHHWDTLNVPEASVKWNLPGSKPDSDVKTERVGVHYWNPEVCFEHNELHLQLHPHFPSRQEKAPEPGCGFHSKSKATLERIPPPSHYPGRGSSLTFRNPAPATGFSEELQSSGMISRTRFKPFLKLQQSEQAYGSRSRASLPRGAGIVDRAASLDPPAYPTGDNSLERTP